MNMCLKIDVINFRTARVQSIFRIDQFFVHHLQFIIINCTSSVSSYYAILYHTNISNVYIILLHMNELIAQSSILLLFNFASLFLCDN